LWAVEITEAIMSDKHVFYLGDTSLAGAAGYLAGLMSAFGVGFDYRPSDVAVSADDLKPPRKLFVLSDYPSKQMPADAQKRLLEQVHNGAGLLMIGGWESFHGHGGDWDGTAVGAALPVEISAEDDRINCDQPALLIRAVEHEIVGDLPFDDRPPTVGGFNRFVAKPGSEVVLLVQRFVARYQAGRFQFDADEQHPMLVLGTHGNGRTAALATDLAPHWVGGLVDWGDGDRITAQASKSWQIEVGNLYAQFIANLLAWTGQLDQESLA
jgi:uncharacterized membrane protein